MTTVNRSVSVGVALLCAALALSACSSSTPGVLTQSDIPSYLGLQYDAVASASSARSARPAPCKTAAVRDFTIPGRHLNARKEDTSLPFVGSVVLACASTSQARAVFTKTTKGAGGEVVAGIGDEALLGVVSQLKTTEYALGWRQGDEVCDLIIVASPTDQRITPALTELLARRAAARG
jgi:hypothetical protein